MDPKPGPPDLEIAGVAARQHGVVSIGQMRRAGLSDTAVQGRVRAGRLHRVHRGVYAVGHRALTFEGKAMAAVLAVAADPPASWGAVVSHRSAAALWRLLPAAPGPVDITLLVRSGRGNRAGIRLHRPRALGRSEATQRNRIPVTTPARTVFDLRRAVPAPQLRRAIRQAEVLGLPLGEGDGGDGTRSELEFLFLRLCRSHGLPAPEVNVRVGDWLVDFLWREQRLVVETDGYRFHRGRQAFEDDSARDLDLRAFGLDVQHLTYRQITREPERVAARLAKALRRRG